MSDLDRKRYEKTGEMSPDFFLSECLKDFEQKKVEGNPVVRIAVVVLMADDTVESGYNDGSELEIIGLLEWAKLRALESLDE